MLMRCSIWIWGALPLKLTVRKPKPPIRTSQFSCTTIRMNTDACEKMHLAMAAPPARVQWLCLCRSHRDGPSVPHATACAIQVSADFIVALVQCPVMH